VTRRSIVCAHCGQPALLKASAINRAAKHGARLFCSRACAGLARRKHKSREQKVAEKAAYDLEYRERNKARIKAQKAAAYRANPNRERERAYRQANRARHVEYCRRPQYRKWKANYDRQHRAQKDFGPFAEAALVLRDLEIEISSRATRTEIYAANGTLNKSLKRRRDYESLVRR
jgi:hypothetical protein